MSSEIFNDVLECGREKMSEGDYLKLAQFLKTLHNKKEKVEVGRKTTPLQIKVEYDTQKGKHYSVIINSMIDVDYEGSPRITRYIGTINGVAFDEERHTLKDLLCRRITFSGIKNIKRSICDDDVEEYPTMRSFKAMLQEMGEGDSYNTEEEYDINNIMESYIVSLLFGISSHT